jgi:hypothetical protein
MRGEICLDHQGLQLLNENKEYYFETDSSVFIPHTSDLIPHTSVLRPHTSYLLPQSSYHSIYLLNLPETSGSLEPFE